MKRYIKSEEEFTAGGENFDGYMGSIGWQGKNASLNLDIKEVAKIIRTQFKKKYPEYKISARISRFSGGEDINIVVTVPKSLLMPEQEFVDMCVQNPYGYIRGYRWIGCYDDNGKWVQYQAEEIGKMSTEERQDFFTRYYEHTVDRYTNDEYDKISYRGEEDAEWPIPLKDDSALQYVYSLMKSFNYRDSNSMVDYYSTNFYGFVYYKYGA